MYLLSKAFIYIAFEVCKECKGISLQKEIPYFMPLKFQRGTLQLLYSSINSSS